MPLPTLHTQYISPPIPVKPHVGKSVEFRINPTGDDRYNVRGLNRTGLHPTNGTSLLITSHQFIGSESSLIAEDELSDTDGVQLASEMAITFLDQIAITGTLTDGAGATSTITQTFSTSGITLSDFLFSHTDSAAFIPCWITLHKNDGTKEIIFSGDISTGKNGAQSTISYRDLPIFAEHSSTEYKRRICTAKIQSWALRAKNTTMALVRDAILFSAGVADMTAQAPFFGGLIAQPANIQTVLNTFATPAVGVNTRDWIASLINGPTWDDLFDVAAYGHYGQPTNQFGSPDIDDTSGTTYTFSDSTWGMKLVRVIKRICDALNYDHTEATDVMPTFEFTRGPYNNSGTVAYEDVIVPIENIEICYNYLFGINPRPGGSPVDFESPITWTAETTISTVLSSLCWQLGCYVKLTIDQTTGYSHLYFVPRNALTVALPSSWILQTDSKEDVQAISKRAVEVTNKADGTTLRVPRVETEYAVKIEVPFRVRGWGDGNTTGPWALNHFVYDYKKKFEEQWVFFDRSDPTQENGLSQDGWVPASHFFYYDSDTSNNYYPSNVGPEPIDDWHGFYMIRSCTEKPGDYSNRQNTLYGPAQFYAKALIGNRKIITRNYIGICDDSGSFADVVLNMTSSWFHAAQVRDFATIKQTRNVITGITSLTWKEQVDFGSDDLTFKYVDDNAKTSSGGGQATTGGNNDYNLTINNFGNANIGVDVNGALNAEYRYQGLTLVSDTSILFEPRGTAVQGSGPSARDWAFINLKSRHVVISYKDTLINFTVNPAGTFLPITIDEYCLAPLAPNIGVVATTPRFKFLPGLAGYWRIGAGVDSYAGGIPPTVTVGSLYTVVAMRNGGALVADIKEILTDYIPPTQPQFSLVGGSRVFDFNGTTDFVEILFYDGQPIPILWPGLNVYVELTWEGPLISSECVV